jgi:hypothetical protein
MLCMVNAYPLAGVKVNCTYSLLAKVPVRFQSSLRKTPETVAAVTFRLANALKVTLAAVGTVESVGNS